MEKMFEPDKLVLFLVFFIPGFITLKVYDLLIPGERRDFSKSLFDAVAYSAINFALLWPNFVLLLSGKLTPFWYAIDAYLLLLIVPALWPVVWIKILKGRRIGKHFVHPNDKAWDFVFGTRSPYWAIVYLKDGSTIGGLFGFNSFASSAPAEPQIYLEQVWKLSEEGFFESPVDASAGIIVLESEMKAVELFIYNE